MNGIKRDLVNWAQLFNERKENPIYNTSYPLSPDDWGKFCTEKDLMFSTEEISFYIHIPFCEHICKFCEYVKYRCSKNTRAKEKTYLDIVRSDIQCFLATHAPFTLRGFDIGGGTPTALSEENFAYLMQIYAETVSQCEFSENYIPSIEATFETISEYKVKLIAQAGFKRISFGLQISNEEILKANSRDVVSVKRMLEVMEMCRAAGISLINIDLMYGFENQTPEMCIKTLDAIRLLAPEHVTFYELRTNMLNKYLVASKQVIYQQYETLYRGVRALSYRGAFGQNTFSLCDDMGLSSYLYSRMIEHVPYKGFGIAAQSRSDHGLSYNIGKRARSLDSLLEQDSFVAEAIYRLPPEEVLAKYMAISGYCGFFRLSIMRSIIKCDPLVTFKSQFEFLLTENYVQMIDDEVAITTKGFKYYGAILSLFYP